MQTPEQNDAFHRDPNNWKWGIIYYNPQDERVFLPKKNAGMGMTLNFARTESYVISLLFLTIPLIIMLLSFTR